MCLSIEERRISARDLDWLNPELYALLALKTTDAALASIVSLEEVEAIGIIGWQRLERGARGYHNQRVSQGISDTLGKSAGKAADLRQAYYRWESNLKVFQRGRPTGLDDDVKAHAMRHVMQKEILDAVNLQPQYRTFVEIRDYMLQHALKRTGVFVREVCFATKKVATAPSRVNTSTKNSTATKNTALVPMDVSQMSSDVSKSEAEGQESDSYQYEQDQDCDGDEVCAVKGNGQGGFKGTCFQMWNVKTQG